MQPHIKRLAQHHGIVVVCLVDTNLVPKLPADYHQIVQENGFPIFPGVENLSFVLLQEDSINKMHRDGVRLKESHCEIEGYTLPECFKQVSVLTFIFAFFGHLKSIKSDL
uniref:Uncharacterized protein n=1 Tax=Daphnia galeata TaxID=27404 RepID=A0A8J2RWU1_9CRUS|nr:unnamed protein product [Daphnia galeata]